MLAEGIYPARAKAWVVNNAGTGTPQVVVEFALLGEYEGQSRAWYGFLTEKAWERTIESLRYCGWKGDDLYADFTGLDANEVDIEIAHEPDQKGVMRERVKWVNKRGGLAVKAPMPPEQLKAFAAQMKAKIRAKEAAEGKKVATPVPAKTSKPPARAEPPPPTDSDMPPF
jgi:hypothetical protein